MTDKRPLITRSLIPWLGMALTLILTLFTWSLVRRIEQRRSHDRFEAETIILRDRITNRVMTHEQILLGASEFVSQRQALPTRQEWRQYVGALDLNRLNPGVQGLGFAEWIPTSALAGHIRRLRAEGFPDYEVHPGGPLPPDGGVSSITCIEPFDERNQRAFSRDMLAEATRRSAMVRARDTGLVALSGMVTLFQEGTSQVQAGTLLYVPVYRQGSPLATVAQRRQALLGWAYMAFRMQNLLDGVLGVSSPGIDLDLFDGNSAQTKDLLFARKSPQLGTNPAWMTRQQVEVAGRIWTLQSEPRKDFYAPTWGENLLVLLLGGFSCATVFTLLRTLTRNEQQALSVADERLENMNLLTERLVLATQAASVGIWDYDLVNNILVWDEHMYRLYGITAGDFIGAYEAWTAGLHPEDVARGDAEIQMAIRGEKDFDTEFRVVWLDGSIHFLRAHALVHRDISGQPLHMIGTNWDITSQKRNEEALRESEATQRTLLAMLPAGVVIVDPVTRIIEQVNEYVATLFGAPVDHLVGQRCHSFLCPACEGACPVCDLGQDVDNSDRAMLRADGSSLPILKTVKRFQMNGQEKLLECFVDVSERQRAEAELREANRAKSEFLANMSHEVRTPMYGVLGMAELLADSDLTPDQQDYVSAINRSGENLLALLNDILDFSKIEAGQMAIETIPFSLQQLVFETAELFRIKLEGRPVELLVDFDPSTPVFVLGDPGRLRQVLNNLVSNALKFTEVGQIVIVVGATSLKESRWSFHLAVQDTGIGIPLDVQARLFQPFTQADSSTARRFGGTGLGLVLVKRIAEAMGGCVRLESQDGVGTTLFVDLPLQVEAGPQAAPARGAELAGKRILVLDDLAINRRLQGRQIEAHGGTAVSAPSGMEALQAIEAALSQGEPFAAVLVDLHMPNMDDGLSFAGRVRSDPRCRTMALLVLTATKVEAGKLAEAGFDGHLLKPIEGDILARALVAAIQRAERGSGAGLVTRHTVTKSQKLASPKSRHILRARVLLVEDQEVNQAVARKFLELAGATVEVARNGRAALEKLAIQTFDVVLMDCQMPEMDGFEATARIRSLEAGTGCHLPILAMTAHAIVGDRERCLAAGMDDYLTKPISREALVQGVARWLPPEAEGDLEVILAEVPVFPTPAPELELDEALFEKLWEVFGRNGKEMTTVVIEPFTRRGVELLQSLRQSAATGDTKGICSTAHALKGSSRTLGLNALGRIAEYLEREGGTAPPATLGAWVEDADQAFQVACRYLRTLSGG